MDAGNWLREKTNRDDFLALLSLFLIRRKRNELLEKENKKRRAAISTRDRFSPKTAYIIRQFKREEEIESLRSIYGNNFFQISAYSSEEQRLKSLAKQITEMHNYDKPQEQYKSEAQKLISRDHSEAEKAHGQRVRETFPLADVIIDVEDEARTRKSCARFIHTLFGDFVTPTRDEFGSFLARSISYRSADLSRQVGAVITSEEGEIISSGCNEVPKPGGGSYWEGDKIDKRDFKEGKDSNAFWKTRILQDAIRRLKGEKLLNEKLQKMEIKKVVDHVLHDGTPPALKDSELMDILEFGRVVHAEMHAITEAARLGKSIKGATLYCTTFPCHICARHIVASGIKRVVYVEPYSKSVAGDLYEDSITLSDTAGNKTEKTVFCQLIGIGPTIYPAIFSRSRNTKRKDKYGHVIKWNPSNAGPVLNTYDVPYLRMEASVVVAVGSSLKKLGIEFNPPG